MSLCHFTQLTNIRNIAQILKKQIMDKRKFNKGKKGVAGNKPKFSPEFGKAKRKMISIPSLKEGEVMKGVDEILKPYLFDKNVKKLLK